MLTRRFSGENRLEFALFSNQRLCKWKIGHADQDTVEVDCDQRGAWSSWPRSKFSGTNVRMQVDVLRRLKGIMYS